MASNSSSSVPNPQGTAGQQKALALAHNQSGGYSYRPLTSGSEVSRHRVANHGFLWFRSYVAPFGNNLSRQVFLFPRPTTADVQTKEICK
jgi:hypothetical protein